MEEKTKENMVTMVTDSGESVDFCVLEETRINARSYLLVIDAPEGRDGKCYILKDISGQQDAKAVYELVEGDSELDTLMKVFEELLSDVDVDLEKQTEGRIGRINLNLKGKGNTAEVVPEAVVQATNQAVQGDNAQDASVQETAGAATPQEQPVKESQNRRPAQRKTASKGQGGSGEAQKKRNTGSRQGQTKSRSGQKGENQTGTVVRESKDSAGARSSEGIGSAKASGNSRESEAPRGSGESRNSGEPRNSGESEASRNSGESKNSRNSGESKALSAPARQKARDGEKDGKGRLKVIPLGGFEQIGTNITTFGYKDSIITVDCGLVFSGDDMLGIDLIIPDVTYLKQNIDKAEDFIITHGHEDHIDALSYILQQVNVPVYGVKLTIALIEHKLEKYRLLKNTERKAMKHEQSVNLGCFRVKFVKANHSVRDTSALVILTPVGTVLHTGDFKIGYTPVFGDPIDLQRFAELGKKSVLTLMVDSTNVIRLEFIMSGRTVGKTFNTTFTEHQNRRIIVATFASNVDRVQQVMNTAYKYGCKAVVEGRSVVTITDTASKLGYINMSEGTFIDIEYLRNHPPESAVLITTGSQGEFMAALSRIAAGIHKRVSIAPGSVVVLSPTPIPGNEKAVANMVNELSTENAKVICQDTHVSRHACQEDLKLIYPLTHLKFSIPIHGEHRRRMAQRGLAQSTGVQKENTVMVNSGDVVVLDEDSYEMIDHVTRGGIFVGGLGVGNVGNIVLRDRQNLIQNGIVVVVLTLKKHSNQLLAGSDTASRDFVYVRKPEDLLEEAHTTVHDAVRDCLGRHVSDWGKIKNIIKDSLNDFLWKRMKRNPMVSPTIMEV